MGLLSLDNSFNFLKFLKSSKLKKKTSLIRVPYDKLSTNLTSSSCTEESWPSVVSVRTSLRHNLGPIILSTALALGG